MALVTRETIDCMQAVNATLRKWQDATTPSGWKESRLEIAHGVSDGYYHLPDGGFRLFHGRKVFVNEWEARDAVVRALRKRVKGWLKELDLLATFAPPAPHA